MYTHTHIYIYIHKERERELTGHVCCLVNAGSRRGGIDVCGYTHTFYTYINTYVTEIYAYMYTHKCTYIYTHVTQLIKSEELVRRHEDDLFIYVYMCIHIYISMHIYIYTHVTQLIKFEELVRRHKDEQRRALDARHDVGVGNHVVRELVALEVPGEKGGEVRYMYSHTHTHTHIHMYIYVYVCIYIYIHIYIYIYIYVYIYMKTPSLCIYTYLYIHIYILPTTPHPHQSMPPLIQPSPTKPRGLSVFFLS